MQGNTHWDEHHGLLTLPLFYTSCSLFPSQWLERPFKVMSRLQCLLWWKFLPHSLSQWAHALSFLLCIETKVVSTLGSSLVEGSFPVFLVPQLYYIFLGVRVSVQTARRPPLSTHVFVCSPFSARDLYCLCKWTTGHRHQRFAPWQQLSAEEVRLGVGRILRLMIYTGSWCPWVGRGATHSLDWLASSVSDFSFCSNKIPEKKQHQGRQVYVGS